MHINLYLIPFIIVLGLFFSSNNTKANRLWYITICSMVLIIVAALRSPSWMTYTYGLDSLVYEMNFESSFEMKWDEFWPLVYSRYVGQNDEGDIGYLFLNKVISWFTHDFYIYSILVDLIFFIPFAVILYRYSSGFPQLIFAFVFYIALVQVFLIGGGRQMSALGLDMMAMMSIMDRKILRAVLYFIIGVTFHFSSLLFLLPLMMIWFKVNPGTLKSLHFLTFLLFPIVLAFPNQIIVFMGETVGMERYAEYGLSGIQGGIGAFIILIECLSLFCLFAIKKRNLIDSYVSQSFYTMAPLLTFFAPLIRSNGSMIRISLYYHIFLIFLVPFSIDCMFKKEMRIIAYSIAIAALAFLTVKGGGMAYYFYWQV